MTNETHLGTKMVFDLFAIGLITAFFAVPLTIWMWSSLWK